MGLIDLLQLIFQTSITLALASTTQYTMALKLIHVPHFFKLIPLKELYKSTLSKFIKGETAVLGSDDLLFVEETYCLV